ncbi:MAG TPA: hypothetical protein PK725_03190 [Rhodocyclaceae bacterium]|nr:hypothetical protein [Rhodocyclaceae bacterium]HRQ45925.1 hypothetical protein [Rhodocyclaceae bacterium]
MKTTMCAELSVVAAGAVLVLLGAIAWSGVSSHGVHGSILVPAHQSPAFVLDKMAEQELLLKLFVHRSDLAGRNAPRNPS